MKPIRSHRWPGRPIRPGRGAGFLPILPMIPILSFCLACETPLDSARFGVRCSDLESAVLNAGTLTERRSAERKFDQECVQKGWLGGELKKPDSDPAGSEGDGLE